MRRCLHARRRGRGRATAPFPIGSLLLALVTLLLRGVSVAGAQTPPAADTTALGRIHTAVLAASPEVKAASSALTLARGHLAAAGFGEPAALSLEAEDVPGWDVGSGSIRVYAEKAFLSPGEGAAARRAAEAEVRAAASRLDGLRRLVVIRADRALVRAIGYGAIARQLAREDSVLSSAEASVRTHFAAGTGAYVDVVRLRSERLRVATARADALAQASAGRRAFEALLPPDAPEAEQAQVDVGSLAARETMPALDALLPQAPDADSLLAASAGLRVADAAVDRARSARALMVARQKPHFTAFLGVQRFMADAGSSSLGPVFGGSISLPFTARRAGEAALAEADLALTAAAADRTARRSTLRAELLAARDLYESARQRMAVYDPLLLEAAQQEREGALASFRSGQLSLTVLLDLERGLSQALTSRLQSEVDAMDALTRLLEIAWNAADSGGAAPQP